MPNPANSINHSAFEHADVAVRIASTHPRFLVSLGNAVWAFANLFEFHDGASLKVRSNPA